MSTSNCLVKPVSGLLYLFLLIGLHASAEDLWYYSYESGVKAFHSGDWNRAEVKLNAALKAQPTQGKRIKTYGTKFIRYIPDYYLGLISFKNGRYQEALDRFAKTKNANLITPDESEFKELLNYVRLAEDRLRPPSVDDTVLKQAQVETAELAQKARTLMNNGDFEEARTALRLAQQKDPTNSSIVDLFVQITQMETELRATLEDQQKKEEQQKVRHQFELLLHQADQALAGKYYSNAREFTRQASELGIDEQAIKGIEKRIADKEKSETLHNANRLASLKIDEEESQALVAFYSADYRKSVALLERVASHKIDSAKVHFYLGCSHAALGLLLGKNGEAELQKSKEYFARARRLNPSFQYDSRYISPRILQLYRR